ncbi:hypothetical protein [Fastidiosibacter lacustris]|uniref:hypothetical protein n=1 Tax=Fastidiosibacter lacustris TaxID=2056695 RepID=UPI000E34C82B|nr:hypothetical protein [Fastidiosibacter lacustris]
MIKSKKILATTVMASLLGGIVASYAATVTDTVQIIVSTEVGPKTLQDVLKLSTTKSTSAPKRAAMSTNKQESIITDFLEWTDSSTGEIGISITSGPTNSSSNEYVIKNTTSGHGEEMPVTFEIGGNEIKSPTSKINFKSLTPGGGAKDLKVIYGDGTNKYQEGKYEGNFDFKIEATF